MQPFSVTVQHGPFLLLVAIGDGAYCDALGMIDMAAAIFHEAGYERVLFDSKGATFRLSREEAAKIGQHIALRLAGARCVGTVVQQRSPGGAGEHAAQAAGLNIRTFTDLNDGFEWMREG